MRKESDPARANQLSLLDSVAAPETLPLALKAALTQAIRGCRFSRYELAAELSEALGRDITKSLIDKWTAESDAEHRVPADVVALLCSITGDMRPLRTLVAAAGDDLVESHEKPELQITRLRMQKVQLEARIRELERRR